MGEQVLTGRRVTFTHAHIQENIGYIRGSGREGAGGVSVQIHVNLGKQRVWGRIGGRGDRAHSVLADAR